MSCAKRPHPHPETQTHLHPGQPSKNDRAEPDRKSASATATPHILLFIRRGTAKTTNPKHTQPTRNHPANEQTPPQYEAEKPDASAELSDARPASPTPGGQSRRAQDHRPNTTARHTVEDGMQQGPPNAKAAHNAHTAQKRPHQPPKNKAPRESAPPQKEDLQHPGPRTCPTPIPLPEAAPQEDPPQGPQKAREPTEPKPIRKPRPIHPETNPGQPVHSNHADPSEPPPPDRKGTGISNQNQDKEPETEPEPPKTKRCPQPSKANHPSPPQKETYTHPNIRTPRAHKTLDTQVDPAPPPPADPLPPQQNVLLEGRSTCNEMGPTRQLRRPLYPPVHQRSSSQGRAPGNAPAQNPGDIPARTQDPQGPARTLARGAMSVGAGPPKESHAATRCLPQEPPKPQPGQDHSPQRQSPQRSQPRYTPNAPTQTPPRIRHNAPQDEAKGAPPPLGDGAN
ncbi:extensin-like [Girardinichthys multiradiatus]|uniref:extensin-like n=1 Tax=Girardinichthys multiradiatus TaxID=208333 RepID=UPI001FADC6D8|nr:extensin-like [Girardinichthys multiradiatus]